MSTKLIARGVKQLDQILHDGGHIVRLRTGGLTSDGAEATSVTPIACGPRRPSMTEYSTLAPLRSDVFTPLGKGGSGQEHIIRALTRLNETIAFVPHQTNGTRPLGIVTSHFADQIPSRE